MKRIFSVLIYLVFIIAAALQASAIGDSLSSAAGTPAVDGAVDAVWQNTKREKLGYCVGGELSTGKLPDSCSAYVSSLHDSEALYFLIEVNDDDFMLCEDAKELSDEIRIYIDEADRFDTTWRAGQVCLIITPDENGRVEVIGDISESTAVAYSRASESRRYIEVKYVPTHYDIAAGKPLLVDFRFNDVYGNTEGKNALAYSLTWSDELNEGDADSSNWSYLRFGSGTDSGEGFKSAAEAASSIGQPLIEGYHYVEGTEGYGGEGPDNLFDGSVGTKFCTSELPAVSVVRLENKYYITGIIMATANDTASYSGRNPDEWIIEGSADMISWNVIAKGDDSFFGAVNFTYFARKVENDGEAYRFLRFTNKNCKEATMQLSELMVCGVKTKAQLGTIQNSAEEDPVFAEDAIFLPISKIGTIHTDVIAGPQVPEVTDPAPDSGLTDTVIVVSGIVILLAVCAASLFVQSKKTKKNMI